LITGDLEKIMHVTSIRREFMRRSESFLKKTPLTTYTTSMFKVFFASRQDLRRLLRHSGAGASFQSIAEV
jgi:hypothetical protein